MALAELTAREIVRAIEECDRLGRLAFLRAHGFHAARDYFLVHGGRFYDSKAVVGAAHGYLPGERPLSPSSKELSGGAAHAVRLLRGLGFAVHRAGDPGVTPLEALLVALSRLRVGRSPDGPRLFQPITLLWAVGRAVRDEPRTTTWAATEQALCGLLAAHGMRNERPLPEYPVAALHRAGLW